MKKLLLATALCVVCLSSAHATDYRFFCTNQSDPAINPDHDGVFVAITYGTDQSFDVVHTISKQLYNRHLQYHVTSITHPGSNSYFWEGFMLNDPHVIMTGHLWDNEGVWLYTENQRFTDGRPPKMATPPIVCRNTVDLRQASANEEQPARQVVESEHALSSPYTGSEVLPYCSLIDHGLITGTQPPMSSQQLLLGGYCLGQMNALLSIAQTYPDTLKSCIPASVTTGQMLAVVVNYIFQHPPERNKFFTQLAVEATQQAWPCNSEVSGARNQLLQSQPDSGDQSLKIQPEENNLDRHGYYTNSSGQEVHQPAKSLNGQIPIGASAQCADGDFSFSRHHSGTCSGHGGVKRWIQ